MHDSAYKANALPAYRIDAYIQLQIFSHCLQTLCLHKFMVSEVSSLVVVVGVVVVAVIVAVVVVDI